MDAIDRDALERAVAVARRDARERRSIDERLSNGDDWKDVAVSSAFHCQSISLGMTPWQSICPAYFARHAHQLDAASRAPFGDPSGRREAAEIFRKLLALDLSPYESDPLAAIGRAERRQQAAS